MEEKSKEENYEEAQFNFALASLQRVHEILQAITKNDKESIKVIPLGLSQSIKRKLVRQLLVQSYPLMSTKNKKELKKKVYSLKLKSKKVYSGGKLGDVYKYDDKLEDEMNDCIIEIQESMQKEGKYFVSKKDEKRLF